MDDNQTFLIGYAMARYLERGIRTGGGGGDEPLEGDHSHREDRTETGELLDVVDGVAGETTHEPRMGHVLDELKGGGGYGRQEGVP